MDSNETQTPSSAPKTEARFSKAGKAAAFVGAGALGATILTGVAFAAPNSPTPSPSVASSTAPKSIQGGDRDHDGPGRGMGRDHGPGRGMGGHVLHGEAVVKDDVTGAVKTVRTVEGTVTAVDGTSITVKASDGFTQKFTVDAKTTYDRMPANATPGQRPDMTKSAGKLSDIKVGDVADINGTVSGDTVTATQVRSMTAAQAKQFEAERKAHEAQEQQQRLQANPSASASPSA